MQEETKLGSEIAAFFSKIWTYIFPVIAGLFGKVGFELTMKKKYSWYEWAGIGLISTFFGFIGTMISLQYKLNPYGTSLIVSMMTLFGQNIALYVIYNYKRIGNGIVDTILRNNTKK